ncbi:zinc transport system permease protein [Halolactibacillus halophilus]|uniref:Membrane protein n=1 Tax=Halolactibacillus halophilus TaxID=306540 RepID=A0A1I5NPL7_9BACI|nr:metal ABC transporter permease [Halolactibacillus halophilus]GEM01412.1 membrane protein [Halolactibacillus halophilus]SFP23627.1 zinc transport system permease protein [Halolactibacillus halophilus]
MTNLLSYAFMQNAIIAAILTSVITAIMGTIIVEKNMVSLSSGIAHTSFGGIGAGYFLGIEPIIGGLFFAVGASLGANKIQKSTGANTGTITSMFWSTGMALGILFIALTPGYPPDMMSYLFGDILSVNRAYLWIIGVLTIIILIATLSYFEYWKLYLFDENYAKVIGINIKHFDIVLYILIALSIVILIKVVGIILSLAMLTMPPAMAKMFTHKLKNMMLLSSLIGMIFTLAGLMISYYLNIPSGASIILFGALSYFLTVSVKKASKKSNT